MRRGDADEADDAGDGSCATGASGGPEHNEHARVCKIGADGNGRFFAKRQRLQPN